MRLFLDAQVSGRRIARVLREKGHDVRAADEERLLDGMGDEELLALAATEVRVLVTFNVADFPRIVSRWAEAGRAHSGSAIFVGIDHSEFGTILRVLDQAIAHRPDKLAWQNYTCFVSRRATQ